jgi:hypothetical protein
MTDDDFYDDDISMSFGNVPISNAISIEKRIAKDRGRGRGVIVSTTARVDLKLAAHVQEATGFLNVKSTDEILRSDNCDEISYYLETLGLHGQSEHFAAKGMQNETLQIFKMTKNENFALNSEGDTSTSDCSTPLHKRFPYTFSENGMFKKIFDLCCLVRFTLLVLKNFKTSSLYFGFWPI